MMNSRSDDKIVDEQFTITRIAMQEENGNLRNAARRLGVTDRALQMRRAARRQHNGGT